MIEVDGTLITLVFTLDATLESFGSAERTSMVDVFRSELTCNPPACLLELRATASSLRIEITATLPTPSLDYPFQRIDIASQAMRIGRLSNEALSSLLGGFAILSDGIAVTVRENVRVLIRAASPPPTIAPLGDASAISTEGSGSSPIGPIVGLIVGLILICIIAWGVYRFRLAAKKKGGEPTERYEVAVTADPTPANEADAFDLDELSTPRPDRVSEVPSIDAEDPEQLEIVLSGLGEASTPGFVAMAQAAELLRQHTVDMMEAHTQEGEHNSPGPPDTEGKMQRVRSLTLKDILKEAAAEERRKSEGQMKMVRSLTLKDMLRIEEEKEQQKKAAPPQGFTDLIAAAAAAAESTRASAVEAAAPPAVARSRPTSVPPEDVVIPESVLAARRALSAPLDEKELGRSVRRESRQQRRMSGSPSDSSLPNLMSHRTPPKRQTTDTLADVLADAQPAHREPPKRTTDETAEDVLAQPPVIVEHRPPPLPSARQEVASSSAELFESIPQYRPPPERSVVTPGLPPLGAGAPPQLAYRAPPPRASDMSSGAPEGSVDAEQFLAVVPPDGEHNVSPSAVPTALAEMNPPMEYRAPPSRTTSSVEAAPAMEEARATLAEIMEEHRAELEGDSQRSEGDSLRV